MENGLSARRQRSLMRIAVEHLEEQIAEVETMKGTKARNVEQLRAIRRRFVRMVGVREVVLEPEVVANCDSLIADQERVIRGLELMAGILDHIANVINRIRRPVA